MPSPSPLSEAQLATIQEELAAGRQPAVWFTPAAVGVDAGKSAKITALTEPAEGDYIQVKPTGSRDVLSFSPNELTMEKPPRTRKAAPGKESAAKAGPAPTGELLVTRERPTRRTAKRQTQPTTQQTSTTQQTQAQQAKPATPRGRTRPPAPVTVTLSSTEQGDWSVEVITGKKRTVKPTPVAASSVAQAAKALGDDVADAIEGVLEAAREQQRARVAQLRDQLEAAQRALAELAE